MNDGTIRVRVNRPVVAGEAVYASDITTSWANLHDSSCQGRVCLNPAHEPVIASEDGERDPVVIDVEPVAPCGDTLLYRVTRGNV